MTNKKTKKDVKTGQFVSDYDPKYDQMLLKHLAEGYSYRSFAGLIGMHRSTLHDWEEKHPSFKLAKDIGIEKGALLWEKIGLSASVGKIKNFNSAAWIFNMKNRYNWTDRQEIKKVDQGEGFINHDKIMEYIERKKF